MLCKGRYCVPCVLLESSKMGRNLHLQWQRTLWILATPSLDFQKHRNDEDNQRISHERPQVKELEKKTRLMMFYYTKSRMCSRCLHVVHITDLKLIPSFRNAIIYKVPEDDSKPVSKMITSNKTRG